LRTRRAQEQVLWNETSQRVTIPCMAGARASSKDAPVQESGCLGVQPKAGGKLHLRLNTGERPIANKYREGKVKSTLKRE